MNTNDAQHMLDDYLDRLHAGLRDIPEEQALEIIAEVRSHVRDAAEVDGVLSSEAVGAALVRFGDAHTLAQTYENESLFKRAEKSRSPLAHLLLLARLAKVSVTGFFVFLGALFGYGAALSFFLAALFKPFFPQIGLWLDPRPQDDFTFVLGAIHNPHAQELLGHWLIPVGFSIAGLMLILTTWLCRWYIQYVQKIKTSKI